MAQTVAEILVDQMVEVGIRKVYGIVGDSANPIVDALRRHESRHRVRPRPQRGGGGLRRRRGRPDLGPPDRRARLVRPGQPAPAQRALRLPAQRGAGLRHRDAHPEHGDRQRLLPGDQPRGHLLRLHQLLRPAVRPRRRCRGSPSSPCRPRSSSAGSGMVILPGDVAAQKVEHPMLRHPVLTDRPVSRPTEAALDKAVELVSQAKKIAIHGGEGTRRGARRGAGRSRASCRPRCRSPTAARTCSRPTTRRRSG